MSQETINLQVGARRFTTLRSTLISKSGFFASLLSRRWEHNKQPDGSYRVDSDPDLFEHILQYLRRGIFPLFYDDAKGHDFAKYNAVLQEAKYFLIEPLVKWLEEQNYLSAITRWVTVTEHKDGKGDRLRFFAPSYIKMECYPLNMTRAVFRCPKQVHSTPEACGKSCRKKGGDANEKYRNEDYVKIALIKTKTQFHANICIDEP